MSKPAPDDALTTVDPASLANVTGGTSAASPDQSQLLTTLTGILDSIKTISGSHPEGFNPQEMMMFMIMMQQRNQPQTAQPPWWGQSGGYWVY